MIVKGKKKEDKPEFTVLPNKKLKDLKTEISGLVQYILESMNITEVKHRVSETVFCGYAQLTITLYSSHKRPFLINYPLLKMPGCETIGMSSDYHYVCYFSHKEIIQHLQHYQNILND